MSPSKALVVVDDDKNISRLMEFGLKSAGFEPLVAKDGQEGLRLLYAHQPALVILDIMMPNMDGWTVCQRIREVSDVPIIMVTARDQDADIVKGLDLGADDYVVKPVRMPVLLARVKACLRRAETNKAASGLALTYADGYLTVDLQTRRVTVRDEPIKLTPTEFNLLARLVQSAGRVLTCSSTQSLRITTRRPSVPTKRYVLGYPGKQPGERPWLTLGTLQAATLLTLAAQEIQRALSRLAVPPSG